MLFFSLFELIIIKEDDFDLDAFLEDKNNQSVYLETRDFYFHLFNNKTGSIYKALQTTIEDCSLPSTYQFKNRTEATFRITKIDERAFSFKKLTNVTIPDSYEFVDWASFNSCEINKILFSKNTTFYQSFSNCYIKSIDITQLDSITYLLFLSCHFYENIIFGNITINGGGVQNSYFHSNVTISENTNLCKNSFSLVNFYSDLNIEKDSDLPSELFRSCIFKGSVNFADTLFAPTFRDGCFYSCIFYKPFVVKATLKEYAFVNSKFYSDFTYTGFPENTNCFNYMTVAGKFTCVLHNTYPLNSVYYITGANISEINLTFEYMNGNDNVTIVFSELTCGTLMKKGTGNDFSMFAGQSEPILKFQDSQIDTLKYMNYYGKNFDNSIYTNCSIRNIILPEGMTLIKYGDLGNTIFNNITLPDSLKEIQNDVFMFSSLNTVKTGSKLERIGDNAFYGSNITSIEFPDSLLSIGKHSFFGCTLLTRINATLNNLEEIGEHAFESCNSLKISIAFHSHLKKIGAYAFYYLSNILSVDFSKADNLETIGDCAFAYCTGMNCMLKLRSLNHVGVSAFECCSNINGPLIFPNTENISDNAFAYCSSIQSITIPITLKYIGKCSFRKCDKLASIIFDSKNQKGIDLSSIELSIGDEAFQDCSAISGSLIFPKTLVSIGNSSFAGCVELTGSISLPAKMRSIGEHAFDGCVGFNGFLDFGGSNITHIGECAFMSCSSLRGKLVLPQSIKSINKNCFSGCQFTGSLVIPDSVKEICENSFYRCQLFTGSLTIGRSVQYIGDAAFSECSGFDGNLIFNTINLTSLSTRCFYKCTGLKGTLSIPKTVTQIGDYAFYGCIGFTGELILPPVLEKIGDSCFSECANFVHTLYIPSSCKNIGSSCFYNCAGLKEIRFENKDCKIGKKAFGHLSIKCFSNLPEICHKNETCYDSDNFGGFNSYIPLNENCSAFYAVNTLITIILFLASCGLLKYFGSFFVDYIKNRVTVSKRLTAVFEEIIGKQKEEEGNENQKVLKIINTINTFMINEVGEDYELSYDKVNDLIDKAITTTWITMLNSSKKQILDKSLDGIIFPPRCSRCKKCFSCKKKDDEKSECDLIGVQLV